MKFIEVEDGLSINIDTIAKFEDFRGRKTRLTTQDGKEHVVNLAYDQFRQLLNRAGGSIEKNLETLARASYTPRP